MEDVGLSGNIECSETLFFISLASKQDGIATERITPFVEVDTPEIDRS
jgi:hypothetical protein